MNRAGCVPRFAAAVLTLRPTGMPLAPHGANPPPTAALRLLILLFLTLQIGAGCTRSEEPKPNILFLLVDTLRVDHVGAYGYDRKTTPFIDSLGRRGTVFDTAIAQAPWTTPSMASIWTSRLPTDVGVGAKPSSKGLRHAFSRPPTGLNDEAVTLAEVLADRGYTTIAVTANSFSGERFFLLQGFADTFTKRMRAHRIFATALERFEARTDKEAPVFLYVHVIDVHQPTNPPKPYDQLFETTDGTPHEKRHYTWTEYFDCEGLETAEFEHYKSHKVALYDGALRFIDASFRKFHKDLAARGLSDNTIIVVASDHGEEFWEHAEFQCKHHIDSRPKSGFGHGHSMSQELLHVPLIMFGPGVPAQRYTALARNLDIAPTLLELAGVPPPPEMIGVNLFDRAPPQIAVSEDLAYGVNARAVQDPSHKLVVYERTKTGQTQFLFDKNRGEGIGSAISDPALVSRLENALGESPKGGKQGQEVTLDEKTLEALRALGYAD